MPCGGCRDSGELPPRARRIPLSTMWSPPTPGTTSACAENTYPARLLAGCRGNYLRVRGEYRFCAIAPARNWELPPRARRIPNCPSWLPPTLGTTSACAENTLRNIPLDSQSRNYLRVRGEYTRSRATSSAFRELPPRARRILPGVPGGSKIEGTTSACAENTPMLFSCSNHSRNYLRVRGEYPK